MAGIERPSHLIEVAAFRQILIWPLTLDHARENPMSGADAALAINTALSSHDGWTEIPDLLAHADRLAEGGKPPGACPLPPETGFSYAEFVYFYDFLQQMLFANNVPFARTASSRRPDTADIRLWRRNDVGGLRIEVAGKTYVAAIPRLNLYVFRTGAVIMALEIDYGTKPTVGDKKDVANDGFTIAGPRLTLSDVLNVNDFLRRSYTPFFRQGAPCAVPSKLTWLDRHGTPLCLVVDGVHRQAGHQPPMLHEDYGFIANRSEGVARRAPVFSHWRNLLSPVVFAGYEAPKAKGPVWRHVLDERIPLMSYVSLSDAARSLGIGPSRSRDYAGAARADLGLIDQGNWVRLCFADPKGSDPMPYNPRFLEEFDKTSCYDRFAPSEKTDSASRFLFAGYHVAMVGAGSFFDDTMVHHFRRHYFQMVLLANMEFASLLATSSRISEAVKRLTDDEVEDRAEARQAFRAEIEDIQESFLRFVHRYRFTGVSNQIQPAELFEKLRASMKIDTLYQDVKDELQAAVDFTSSVEQGQIARSSMGLTVIATIGAAVGLALTLLGLGLIGDPLKTAVGSRTAIDQLMYGLGIVGLATGLFLAGFWSLQAWMSSRIARWADRMKPDLVSPLFGTFFSNVVIACLVIGAFFIGAAIF